MKEHFSKKKYFLWYTLLFAVMASLVYAPFAMAGKSFIWSADTKDGLVQHYNALMYYGKILRELGRTLLRDHTLVLPEYSFSLGMGADVLRTLHYYVIGDPLNLLSALVPAEKTYLLYDALILVRLYLAGFCFSVLAIGRRQKSTCAILAGSMVYTFCGFALMAGVKHPYFLNPMIYLPLIILGIHLYLEKRNPLLYIFSVAIAALSNLYFLYMIAIITAFYILLTLIEVYHNKIRELLRSLLGLVASTVLSAAMAAVILLPVASSLLSDSRVESPLLIRPFYSLRFYQSFAAQFTAFGSLSDWTYMVYGLPTLAAVFLLFKGKGNRKLKILFVTGILCLLLPYAGHVMNGFSYAVNRWCFAFSLLCAYILVKMWPDLFCLRRSQQVGLTAFLLLYICLAFALKYPSWIPAFGIVSAVGLGSILIFFLGSEESYPQVSGKTACLALVSILLSVFLNAYYCYHPDQSDFLTEFSDLEYVRVIKHSRYPDTFVKKQIEENGESLLSRYSGQDFQRNSSLRYGTSTTQYFWSLSNPYMASYREDLLLSEDKPQTYTGFDDSTFLNELAAVAYHVTSDEELLPYGYEEAGKAGSRQIYHNRYALPIAYSYDACYSHASFDGLTPAQKAEAMLQGVLLEQGEPELTHADPVLTSHELDFEVISSSDGNVIMEENAFVVLKGDASIKLSVFGESEAETIFYLYGQSYEGYLEIKLYNTDPAIDPENRYNPEDLETLGSDRLRALQEAAKIYTEPDKLILRLDVVREDHSALSRKIQVTEPTYVWYTGRKDYTLNLGYAKSPVREVTLYFPHRGIYRFDSLGFVSQPMENYTGYVQKLMENAAEKVRYQDNTLTCRVKLDQTKFLCFAIPYDKGWTAYVDGKQAAILQANTAYMGLMLRPGSHEIRLVYRTPYLRAGMGISAAAWICFLLLPGVDKIRKRRKAGGED